MVKKINISKLLFGLTLCSPVWAGVPCDQIHLDGQSFVMKNSGKILTLNFSSSLDPATKEFLIHMLPKSKMPKASIHSVLSLQSAELPFKEVALIENEGTCYFSFLGEVNPQDPKRRHMETMTIELNSALGDGNYQLIKDGQPMLLEKKGSPSAEGGSVAAGTFAGRLVSELTIHMPEDHSYLYPLYIPEAARGWMPSNSEVKFSFTSQLRADGVLEGRVVNDILPAFDFTKDQLWIGEQMIKPIADPLAKMLGEVFVDEEQDITRVATMDSIIFRPLDEATGQVDRSDEMLPMCVQFMIFKDAEGKEVARGQQWLQYGLKQLKN